MCAWLFHWQDEVWALSYPCGTRIDYALITEAYNILRSWAGLLW